MPNDEQNIQNLKEAYNFEITPCDKSELNSGNIKKLELNSSQKSQISFFVSQIPLLATAGATSKLYAAKLPIELTPLKQGGYYNMIRGNDGFIGVNPLYHPTAETALLAAFSVMSIATGQYFLAEINNEFKMLNQKIDKIVGFLYGDKKAELMSEISFVQFAYKNFNSLVTNEYQRTATITGLQEARKVAMKDIEFYLCDLDGKASSSAKSYADFETLAYDAFKLNESLELATQLYIMSSIMEVYYAQNYDTNYIDSLKDDIAYYIGKCEKRLLTDFGKMNGHLAVFQVKAIKKINSEKLNEEFTHTLELLNGGEWTKMNQIIDSLLNFSERKNKYYLSENGEVYIKTTT